MQRNEQSGAADAGGAAAGGHPVPLHALHQLHGRVVHRHALPLRLQPQLGGEAVQVQRRVQRPARPPPPATSTLPSPGEAGLSAMRVMFWGDTTAVGASDGPPERAVA